MEDKEMMNIIEVTRLQEWLEAYGVPPDMREECIKYIARESDVRIKKASKRVSHSQIRVRRFLPPPSLTLLL